MPIVGGFDVHRRQITFDYLDTATGQVRRGRIAPACRATLRAWLARTIDDPADASFAVEGCTGWRFVVEELERAGIAARLAEPADTASQRGPKRRAKTDRADAQLLRELLVSGRLPSSWIPPMVARELRATLELYHDLHTAHTAWVQRVHAALFHQGTPALAVDMSTAEGRQRLAVLAEQLSPAGQQAVAVALRILDSLETELDALYRQISRTAAHLRGAKALQAQYGVGPLASAALLAWLGEAGRFAATRKAVRYTGLDITVYSSDGKRTRGHLSRQGPPMLRWVLYEAAKHASRTSAPDHDYYQQVKESIDGKRATLAVARKIVRRSVHILSGLGEQAFAAA
jgi:transposase